MNVSKFMGILSFFGQKSEADWVSSNELEVGKDYKYLAECAYELSDDIKRDIKINNKMFNSYNLSTEIRNCISDSISSSES